MKRKMISLLAAGCCLGCLNAAPALAYVMPAVTEMTVAGSPVSLPCAPFVTNDTTMVPMRVIFEALGAEVDYNAAGQKITAVKDDTTIELTVGSQTALKNGQAVNLDAAATTRNGNTMVPLRFVAEALGTAVDWQEETQTIAIPLAGNEIKIVLGRDSQAAAAQSVASTSQQQQQLENTTQGGLDSYEKVKTFWENSGGTVVATEEEWDRLTAEEGCFGRICGSSEGSVYVIFYRE